MLTVLVATRNGARTLPHVLEGYRRLLAPAGGWKLVIVDNASTDGTGDVVHRFASSLPLTYCEEPRPGKNRALLTGLREAEGDLVAFSDDDATPDRAWLASLRRAADERLDFDVFAGTIRPRWEVLPERWVLDDVDLAACYAITDPARRAGPIPPTLVPGANMAVRSRVFERGYRFDPEVGPCGGDYAMGSETDLTVRLAEAGFKAWFCPEAVVEHFIRAHQVERKWILERAIRFGRGTYRRRLLRQVERPRLWFGVPRHLYRQIATRALRYSWAVVFRRRGSFRERWAIGRLLGCAIQARRHYSDPTRPLPRPGPSVASME
jgi:glycosyltransferase involved in cell wall biosynthesis